MPEDIPYGQRRDYPKICIYVDGDYVGTTTWARTCKIAREQYAAKAGIHISRVQAKYKDDEL